MKFYDWLHKIAPSMFPRAYLTGPEIRRAIQKQEIVIEPYDAGQVAQHSLDVHLCPVLLRYNGKRPLDLHQNSVDLFDRILMDRSGHVLEPGEFYLGATIERLVKLKRHGFIITGKSSAARMGLAIEDAGFGEPGFCGPITLEIKVPAPLRVYPGSPVGQLRFFDAGDPSTYESYRVRGNYKDALRVEGPQVSRSYLQQDRHGHWRFAGDQEGTDAVSS